MSDLEEHVAWLRAKVTLDEEAGDPEGILPGLSEALRMAQEALRRAAEPPDGVTLTVWADSNPLAALSGSYGSAVEGFTSAILAVLDLWNAGESGIQVELYREMNPKKERAMPKIVDEMPDRSRASKYPWDEWLDGRCGAGAR